MSTKKQKRKRKERAQQQGELAFLHVPRRAPQVLRFYWAYGSNLNVEQMLRRCPDAEQVGALLLDNAMLIFRNVADVERRAGEATPGGLWRISAADEAALDAYEGVRSGRYLKTYIVLGTPDGEQHRCLVYRMRDQAGIFPPSDSYIEKVLRGYQDFGLDPAYLERALQASWTEKHPTGFLRHRHEMRGGRLARALPVLPDAPTTERIGG